MIVESFDWCPACVLGMPYDRTEPWQCPTCKLWHAVPCEPTPTNDPDGLDEYLDAVVRYVDEMRVKADIPRWLADVMIEAVLA